MPRLTQLQRGMAIGMLQAGQTPTAVARQLGCQLLPENHENLPALEAALVYSTGVRMEHTPSGILPTACGLNEMSYCLFECPGWSHTILTLTLLHVVFFKNINIGPLPAL